MFAVRRIFRDSRRLTNYISTSSVIKKDDPKVLVDPSNNDKIKGSAVENVKKKKKKVANSTQQTIQNVKVQQPREDSFKKLLKSSADKVAEEFEGDKKEIRNELLNYISSFEVGQVPSKKSDGKHIKNSFDSSQESWGDMRVSTGKLFFFHKNIMSKPEVQLNIWDDLEAEYLAYLSKRAPRNYFEELIDWTNSGRLWYFPIDNDQGNEVEARTSFTEHVFLDQHLEPWCPKKGPLRRFMELVLIGLAKNNYYSVEEKVEHIRWFENYFEKKKKLLKDLGAMGGTKEIDTSGEKQNSSES